MTDESGDLPALDTDGLAAALEAEAEIGRQAREIRKQHSNGAGISVAELEELMPLLREPIPSAFIQTIGVVRGKPYVSTGIRSVQVQIDRMNAVLGVWRWSEEIEYADGGKLCTVTIRVAGDPVTGRPAAIVRSATGGVNQGSTLGNVYKGSYTNAAKRAFAAIGVGHEIYVGAADLDPDTNADVAAKQAEGDGEAAKPAQIGKALAKKLVDRAWPIPSAKSNLRLAASHVADRDIGDCATKAKATDALADLSYGEAERVSNWLDGKEADGAKPEAG